MYELNVGSMLLSAPERTDIKNSRIIMKWIIPVSNFKEDEKVYLVKETVIDNYMRILMWLDIYSHIFPEIIIEDAKRIAYDFRNVGFLKKVGRVTQQFVAMVCLNISCLFHDFDFMSKKEEILRARDEGRTVFGVDVKRQTTTSRHFTRLGKYTKMGIDVLPDDKFNILNNMHKRMGERDGRKMGSLCGNEQVA